MNSRILLGIQGWHHAEWLGSFYPHSLEPSARLGEYSKRFSTVEVDDTFYGIPPEPVVRMWRDSVPGDFMFALKAPQQVTHEQRFSGQGGLLKRFLARVSLLDGKLGPILLLAPPSFRNDETNKTLLRAFFEQLPKDFKWAIELKHFGWLTEEIRDLLASNNVALVSGENRWIRRPSKPYRITEPAANFAYVRWNDRLTSDTLEIPATTWAGTLEEMSSLADTVYGYFNINAYGTYGNGLLCAEKLQLHTSSGSEETAVSIEQDASWKEGPYGEMLDLFDR